MSDALFILNVIYFLIYVVLATLVVGKLVYRTILYLIAREPVPILLKRDVLLFAVLVGEIAVILLARAFDVSLMGNVIWLIGSGAAAIGALAYYAYVEYFKIGG